MVTGKDLLQTGVIRVNVLAYPMFYNHYYQTTENQDEGAEQQVDGDNDEYQEASYIAYV